MKKNILLLLLMLFVAVACQNNGYIGELFGRWKLTTIENNGQLVRSDSIFYSFQRNIINIKKLAANDKHELQYDMFGEFWHQGDSMKFVMYKLEKYQCPDVALNDSIECFDIEELTWKKMTLVSRINGQRLRFVKH